MRFVGLATNSILRSGHLEFLVAETFGGQGSVAEALGAETQLCSRDLSVLPYWHKSSMALAHPGKREAHPDPFRAGPNAPTGHVETGAGPHGSRIPESTGVLEIVQHGLVPFRQSGKNL